MSNNIIAKGAALLGGVLLLAAPSAHAALMAVSNPANVSYANLNDAVGTVYAAGQAMTYGSARGNVSVSSNLNNLERNDQSSYIDSNFASTAEFINQCGYSGLSTCNAAGAVTIAFAMPTLGFTVSADDFDTTASYMFTLTAFNGATSLGNITASSLADNGASPAVLAATSTTAVTSVRITDPTGNFALANIGTFAPAAAVPEPATLAVLGAGLAGLAGLRRRRA